MKSIINHLELSVKNKQCFMCKHYTGNILTKQKTLITEKCNLLNIKDPYDWNRYYQHNKHPPYSLSACNGKYFYRGGIVYKQLENLIKDN